MQKKTIKNNIVLIILFFLPVVIVLFLYTTDHNNSTLDIVKENVLDLKNLPSIKSNNSTQFENHITVLSFLGNNPESHILEASNLKELVYNKFKGFKTFQLVTIFPFGAESKAERLRLELTKYKPLEYWKFIYASQEDINRLFSI